MQLGIIAEMIPASWLEDQNMLLSMIASVSTFTPLPWGPFPFIALSPRRGGVVSHLANSFLILLAHGCMVSNPAGKDEGCFAGNPPPPPPHVPTPSLRGGGGGLCYTSGNFTLLFGCINANKGG